MSDIQNPFPEFNLFRVLRTERIKKPFVLTGRVHAALNAQLLHGIDKAKACSYYTD